MKCFYHNADLDGHCSGALIKMTYPDCEMIGIDYGDIFPWDKIEKNEKVYMVDFSLESFEDMVKLAKRCDLCWIDHHISKIRDAKNHPLFDTETKHLLVDGIGACHLVWNKFYAQQYHPTAIFVKLLSEYDVWILSDPRTLPFQYGMKIYDTNPNNQDFWIELFDVERVNQIIDEGNLILKYQDQKNKKYIDSCACEVEFMNYKCIAVNKISNSKIFEYIHNIEEYDIMITFVWASDKWKVTLYTNKDDIDVSIIAKSMGGGGHKKAAGFICTELPFSLVGKESIEDKILNNFNKIKEKLDGAYKKSKSLVEYLRKERKPDKKSWNDGDWV